MDCKIKWLRIVRRVIMLCCFSVSTNLVAQPPGNISIRLSRVESEVAQDTLRAGDTVTFHIMYSFADTCHYNVSNAFRVYSRAALTSGNVGSGTATWVASPPTNRRFGIQFDNGVSYGLQVDTTGFIKKSSCLGLYKWSCFSCDGSGSDTVAFQGAVGNNLEWPMHGPDSGVAFVLWVVTNVADSGKVICIDSCTNYPPSGTWRWPSDCYPEWVDVIPSWGGSRCFVLAARSCCIGQTGNVDCSVDRNVDIGDVTALVDHLYFSLQTLCCVEQANCDGKPGVDIGDLTALIDYLYISFVAPADCE
jgi:hypothetical protein